MKVLSAVCSLVLLTTPFAEGSASVATPSVQPPPSIEPVVAESKGNPVMQLAGYVKDSFVRMKDGSVQLYSNHKRCNEIRSKQKEYLKLAAANLPESEQKAAMKYRVSAGGILYEEFDFLVKGKDDRGKLANIVFMMFFAPNFVPYAFMFFPEMLPSPFSMPMNKMGMPHSKWSEISRERTHAVISTLLDLEKAARIPPMMSNINPFGKGRTKKMMERMDKLGHDIGGILLANNANGSEGADLVFKVLSDEIYSAEKPNKQVESLGTMPKAVVKGLGRALEAPSFNSLIPSFIVKGKVLNSLKQIENADNFLVAQDIDLNSLSYDLLQEACSARLIGGPGRSSEEMVQRLTSWLDTTVKEPKKVTEEKGLHYNGNFARASLLCYNLVDSARDGRAASYLPRLLFQGQMNSSAVTPEIEEGGKRKKNKK